MTYNPIRFLTQSALLFQHELDSIDTADTPADCSKHAERAFGIVITLRTFANALPNQDQIDDIYDLMSDWSDQIEDHHSGRSEELGFTPSGAASGA